MGGELFWEDNPVVKRFIATMFKWHSIAWLAAIGTFALAAPAAAGERLPYVGMEYYIADPADTVQLEEGHVVILGRWNGTFVSE